MDDWSFCTACGAKCDPDTKFCSACGAAIPSATTVASGDVPSATDSDLEALESELRVALSPGLHLTHRMGQGGMGTVFLARDPVLKRDVVVKVLSPELADDPTARARFAREAEAAAAVSHSNVINVYSVGELPRSGTSYFVMQHVDGPTLAEEFPAGSAVAEARVKRVVGEVASALAAAHDRGLVHRDIKPPNIMIERDSGRAIVLDFGISAAITPEVASKSTKLTVQGTSIGTPQYMSPEQAAGEEVTGQSDVYSMGVVAFELITGRSLFDESTPIAYVAAHIHKTPAKVSELRPDVDAALATLIDRCLAKAPTERPAAQEVAKALGRAPEGALEWPPPGLDKLRAAGRQTVGALAVTALGILAVVMVWARAPSMGSPFWHQGELSAFWRFFEGPFLLPGDVSAIWLGALFVSGLLVDVGLVASFVNALRLGKWTWWSLRSGFPPRVIFEVVSDLWSDTESLYNGTGAFALAAQSERRTLLRLRRVRAALVGPGFLLAPLSLPLAVILFTPDGVAFPISPISSGEAFIIAAPTLAMILLVMLLAVPERRYLRRTRRGKRKSPWLRLRPTVRSELVSSWLKDADVEPPRPRSTVIRHAISAAPVAVVLIVGVWIWGAIALTGLSTALARRLIEIGQPRGTRVLETLSVDSLRPPDWRLSDSIFSASAWPTGARHAPDLAAARGLFASYPSHQSPIWDRTGATIVDWPEIPRLTPLSLSGQEVTTLEGSQPGERELVPGENHNYTLDLEANMVIVGQINKISTHVVVRLFKPDGQLISTIRGPHRGPEPFAFTTEAAGTYRFEVTPAHDNESGRYVALIERVGAIIGTPVTNFEQAWASLPGGLQDSVREALDTHAKHSALALWRSIAATDSLPSLWFLRAGFGGLEWEDIPRLPDATTVGLARSNEAAAILALDRGDVDEAVEHARESIAFGLHLLRQPERLTTRGREIIEMGYTALAEIGRVVGDSLLVAEAGRLQELSSVIERTDLPRHGSLVASPTAALLPEVGDRGLRPSERIGGLGDVIVGFCGNAREIILGVDPRRHQLLVEVERGANDIERIEDIVEAYRRSLDRWIAEPSEKVKERMGSRYSNLRREIGPLRLLRLPGFHATWDRWVFCIFGGDPLRPRL